MTWQPIETAPKDGTAIIVYAADAIEPHQSMVFWTEFRDSMDRVAARHWTDLGTEQKFDVEPTHWQPLPDPPA